MNGFTRVVDCKRKRGQELNSLPYGTYLVVGGTESAPHVLIIQDLHLKGKVLFEVLDDHDEEGQLDAERAIGLCGARYVRRGDVCSNDLQHGRLDVIVCDSLNVAIADLFLPDLQRFAPVHEGIINAARQNTRANSFLPNAIENGEKTRLERNISKAAASVHVPDTHLEGVSEHVARAIRLIIERENSARGFVDEFEYTRSNDRGFDMR